ncbi:MAG: hypothetical protein QM696_10395 [Steroidobacteraceae bacterium]
MRRLWICGLALAAALAGCAAAPRAASTGNADFSGLWLGERLGSGNAAVNLGIRFDPATTPGEPDRPPLTPEYAAKFEAALQARRNGDPFPDPTAECLPGGFPRMMGATPFPMEILMTPGKVTMIFEWLTQVRHVYTDGRGHPAEVDPTYSGHSIGHWEGNALVVETVGLRPETLISQQGLQHSDVTKVVERFRLREDGKLEDQITIIDPKMLTQPWTVTRTYTRQPKERELQEFVCLDGVLKQRARGR